MWERTGLRIIVGEYIAEGPECNLSAATVKILENIGKCRKASKKYKNNHFFNYFNI